MGFGAAVGEVVQEGAGGAAGIVGAQLFQHGPLEAFDQFPVGLLGLQPVESQAQQLMESSQIGIRLGGLLDGLGEVGGGEEAGVGLAQAGAGTGDAGLAEMMEAGPAGRFPADLAFVKQIEVAPHRVARFGRSLGEGADHPVAAGQPDREEAGFPLAAEMKQNPFILKRLAQGLSLAEGANREDKRDDSAGGRV